MPAARLEPSHLILAAMRMRVAAARDDKAGDAGEVRYTEQVEGALPYRQECVPRRLTWRVAACQAHARRQNHTFGQCRPCVSELDAAPQIKMFALCYCACCLCCAIDGQPTISARMWHLWPPARGGHGLKASAHL